MPQSETTDKCSPRTGIQELKKQICLTWKCHNQRQQTDVTPVLGYKNLRNK